MDLTPAETTLIDLLRDRAIPSLGITVARSEDGVVVTLSMPGEGVSIGAGPSFEAAFFDVCGRELPTDVLGEASSVSQH